MSSLSFQLQSDFLATISCEVLLNVLLKSSPWHQCSFCIFSFSECSCVVKTLKTQNPFCHHRKKSVKECEHRAQLFELLDDLFLKVISGLKHETAGCFESSQEVWWLLDNHYSVKLNYYRKIRNAKPSHALLLFQTCHFLLTAATRSTFHQGSPKTCLLKIPFPSTECLIFKSSD